MRNILISDEAAEWLENGSHGISSETIFSALTGLNIRPKHRWSTPHDPDDFRRCVWLIESVPDFAERLGELAEINSQWAALVESWQEIISTFDAECPNWRNPSAYWNAPKTYKLMRKVLGRKS